MVLVLALGARTRILDDATCLQLPLDTLQSDALCPNPPRMPRDQTSADRSSSPLSWCLQELLRKRSRTGPYKTAMWAGLDQRAACHLGTCQRKPHTSSRP